jgi:CheY-like chemotaxis protein
MSAPRILIVDDNELNVELAGFLLMQAGMAVASALDGRRALEQVQRFEPDLVLMDMQLPGFDGLALTQQLRAQLATRPMAIVAFTAYAMMGDKEKFLAAGCDGYIAKPIQVGTFADEVRALLPRPWRSAARPPRAKTQE